MNSQSSVSAMSSPKSCNSTNCLSPFNIKRKCLSSLMLNNSSPSYSLSSINLGSQFATATNAPVAATLSPSSSQLNDSFDENISCKRYMLSNQQRRRHSKTPVFNQLPAIRRNSAGTLFARYKSEPLTSTLGTLICSSDSLDESLKQQQQQPLNDISNLLQLKHKASTNGDFFGESQQNGIDTDVNDLENLIYGNGSINSVNSLEHQQLIKQSLEIEANCHGQLIGDRSKKHILPTIVSNKHQDLHCISPHTLVEVLDGAYNSQIDECIVIDSRYPYEYDAGHIRDAKNIFTKQKLYDEFFLKRHFLFSGTNEISVKQEVIKSDNSFNKRVIIIFHCEFSSERGPSLLKFLRNQDRTINELHYPNLFYPELYLLEGGYKSFYLNFKNYCEPQDYKPMLHAEHLNELRHFRAKAKSWSNEPLRQMSLFQFDQQQQQQQQYSGEKSIDSPNLTSDQQQQHKQVKMKAFY